MSEAFGEKCWIPELLTGPELSGLSFASADHGWAGLGLGLCWYPEEESGRTPDMSVGTECDTRNHI